ncbi:MAG TPA: protein kinase [Alphaproteobacteria bacterium]
MSDTNIHALPIGHTIDGYRILRLLGAGGFGITYLAEETTIGRKVAIKEYLPQGFAARAADSVTVRPVSASSQEQFAWGLDRFRKEAATLVAFEHPNIVSVYRYFEANGTAYLVMQYVEGKPLDALLAGGKTLAESEIEEVILPILDGLEQVHAAHFLHRDIKPANIYIRIDGRPVLLDFGAARQAFGSETKSITAIVSEGYAPFEQYEAKGDQGPWTDIYAIGAVLYRCIAGQRPPAAPERISARLRGAPDPMAAAREAGAGRYGARLLEATDRALATMQGERPQSIAELRQMLRASDRATVSRAPARRGVADSAGKPASRPAAGAAKAKSRLPLAAGIAGVLLAGGAGAYFALSPGPAPGPVASAPTAPPTTARSTTPAQPAPAQPGPPQPAPEDLAAEREAREAAQRAESDLAQVKSAAEQGNLERARDDLEQVQRRLEDALQKRPRHAELERVRALAAAAEGDLGRRIAARVKELIDAAEREAPRNYDEAQRRLAEAERLDPAAAKSARERIEQGRRRSEDDKRREDEARRARVELHVSLARYHFDQARAAVTQGRLADARRVVEQVKIQLTRAVETAAEAKPPAGAESPLVKALRGEVEAFERDLGKRIAERMAVLLREARAFMQAGKLDEAAKRLEEAAGLEPASTDLAAARREFEEARQKPQPPADPDAAQREQTRTVVRDSVYDGRGRRGAAYFAFGSGELAPPALQMLARGADAAKGAADAHLNLFCGYDLLEAKDAAEGRKLAQERCEAAQRAAAQRGLPAARIRAGFAASGKGPDFRRVAFAVQSDKPAEKPPEATKAPDTSRPGAFPLAGRTARLSRISAERRVVMRIELSFNAGGALAVSCSAESADGGQQACFGQRSGTGRWSLNGSTLCVSSAVINLPGKACYELSGSGNQLRLAGGGLLAGVMLLQ